MRNSTVKTVDTGSTPQGPKNRLRGWGTLAFALFLLWGFAAVVGPWAQQYIPLMDQIVQVAEERDIDMGAYFYTEIEASYNGERYLKKALDHSAPGEAAFTLPLVGGIIFCVLLLALGFRYLPLD